MSDGEVLAALDDEVRRRDWTREAREDADPRHPIPDIESEYPGVVRWFELRRNANRERELEALLALRAMPAGDVADVPLAGGDWPYGQPVEVGELDGLARKYAIPAEDYRVYAIPDPPGTVLRVRRSGDDRAPEFVEAVCVRMREREAQARAGAESLPFAALCVHFAARVARVGGWMGGFAPAGLSRTAPPDAVAVALAAHAASLVMDLPVYRAHPYLGDPALDVVLDATHHMQSVPGRARLDAVERAAMDVDPSLGLRVHVDAVDGRLVPRWRVCGMGGGKGVDARVRDEVVALAGEAVRGMAVTLPTSSEHRVRTDFRFATRVGHGVASAFACMPHDVSFDELAVLFAAEHGLGAGFDRRVRWFAAEIGVGDDVYAMDFRLALDRIASIDGDPCAAQRIRDAVRLERRRRGASFEMGAGESDP